MAVLGIGIVNIRDKPRATTGIPAGQPRNTRGNPWDNPRDNPRDNTRDNPQDNYGTNHGATNGTTPQDKLAGQLRDNPRGSVSWELRDETERRSEHITKQ